MRFIGLVQIAFEKALDAEVRKLFVSSCQDVHVDGGPVVLKTQIYRHNVEEPNKVTLQLRTPLNILGSTMTLTFINTEVKERFLSALGELNSENER
jgi:hypothetical protein